MKDFILSVCFCSFSIIGGIIGAGFITGAEIVRFFPLYTVFPCCFLLFVLLFLFLFGIMSAGANYGEKQSNLRVLGAFYKIYEPFVLTVSFISVVSMCAGIDNLVATVSGVSEKIPSASLPLIVASYFVCKKGVNGIGVFNLVLVPVMILFILPLGAGLDMCETGNYPVSLRKIAEIIIYAGMNCFTSAPLLFEQGEKYGLKAVFAGALFASLIVSVCVGVVVVRIAVTGSGGAMPIMSSLLQNRTYYSLFAFITALGIVTTLVCAHFALVSFASKYPVKRTLNGVIILLAIAVSRLGFESIINFVYPLVGVFGAAYCISIAVFSFRNIFFQKAGKRKSLLSFGVDFPFRKRNERVHTRGENAKNESGGVNEVESENLPSVNDEIADARFGNKVFSHNRADPT